MNPRNAESRSDSRRQFETTRWSVVLAAAGADAPQRAAALQSLCQSYWYPLYAYVRSQGRAHADAADLTQGFFASLLARNDLHGLRPERGRFRAFLLAAMKHFLINDWHHQRAAKRGGGRTIGPLNLGDADARYRHEPAHEETPEAIYERAWARALLDRATALLQARYESTGKSEQFAALQKYLAGDRAAGSYHEAAAALGIGEAAVKVAVHRMRRRFRDALRAEIAHTVPEEADIDAEIRDLFDALRR